MLTVRQFPVSSLYVTPGGCNVPLGRTYRATFVVATGPIGSDTDCPIVDTLDGWIRSSEKHGPDGDRDCVHYHYDGDVTLYPFPVRLLPSDPLERSPIYEADGTKISATGVETSSTFSWTHMIRDGEDLVYTVPFDSRDGLTTKADQWGTWTFRAKRVGRNVIHGRLGEWTSRNSKNTQDIKNYYVALTLVSYDETFTHTRSTDVLKCTKASCFEASKSLFFSMNPYGLGDSYTSYACYRWAFSQSQSVSTASIIKAIGNLRASEERIFHTRLISTPFDIWGTLVQDCLNRLDYVNVNVIQFVLELRDVKKLLPKLSGLLNPKTYASAYLWFKYGISLTIQDTKALAKSITQALGTANKELADPYSRVYALRTFSGEIAGMPWRDEYRYKMIYYRHPNEIMQAINDMTRWGVYPTLENAWDMIPFSFVIDWAIPVQSLLERLDTKTQLQYYRVVSVCRSRKCSIDIPAERLIGVHGTGCITQVMYIRENVKKPDVPVARIDAPGSFNNYAEAAALIVQRKR